MAGIEALAPRSYTAREHWQVQVHRDWFRDASLGELRQLLGRFDMMIEDIVTHLVTVSGFGDMPEVLQQFVAHDQ